MRRQAQAASSYSALLNPLVISLLALLPHATIDTITLIMSAIGLVTTLMMGLFLLHDSRGWVKKWTSVFFLLVGLVLLGFELFSAIQLDRAPGESSTLYHLATLLVLIDLYGIARAWDLVGVRQFNLREVLSPLLSKAEEQTPSEESSLFVFCDLLRFSTASEQEPQNRSTLQLIYQRPNIIVLHSNPQQ